MNASKKVILIEFNELTPSLMTRFMADGNLPNFKRFHGESQVFVTDAEEDGEDLNPWVQWITVHTGLSADEHGVRFLSDGHKLTEKSVWDLLSDVGGRVWVCGSMNARYDAPLNGHLLPDPWSTGIDPYPAGEFASFYRYVRNAVQEHTNTDSSSSRTDTLSFLKYLVTHGLSFSTFSMLVRQLLHERRENVHWKRAACLDRLQFDVFRHYFRKYKPHFSTYFLNSTAHYQHKFWRNMEPELFDVPPSSDEGVGLESAILFGYQRMDEIIGKFIGMADQDTTLVFCTALGQQPYVGSESSGGRHYYRLKSPEAALERLGVENVSGYEPVMAEQCYLRFENDAAAEKAERVLSSYSVKDDRVFDPEHSRLFHTTRNGSDIMMQCRCTKLAPDDIVATSDATSLSIPFHELFYGIDGLKSGRHHPDGIL